MRDPEVISVFGLELLPHERRLLVGGRTVELTAREFDILARLAAHPGWVYSPEQLADGEEGGPDASPDSVRVHVAHLRQKLGAAGAQGSIGTVRGVGYRLEGEAGVTAGSGAHPHSDETCETCADHNPADSARHLHDALWDLERTVLEAEKAEETGKTDAAAAELERARERIDDLLGEE